MKRNHCGRPLALFLGALMFLALFTRDASAARVVDIYLNPDYLYLSPGQMASLSVVKVYDNGDEVCCAYSGVQWQSWNSSVASVSWIGEVLGKSGGDTYITAKYKGITAYANVSVTAPVYLWGIHLTPDSLTMNVGEQKSLAVVKEYSDGSEACCTYSGVAWWSDDPSVAFVSMVGDVQGIAGGSTYINARYSGFDSWAYVTVHQPRVLTGIRLTPGSLSMNVGQQQTLSVVKQYSDGSEKCCTYAGVQWQSDNSAIAFVLGGEVQGISAGNTAIRATYQGFTAQAPVTVIQPVYLTGIRLSSTSFSLTAGNSKTLRVYKQYSDGTETCCASGVQWQSDSTAVASVNMSGEVTGISGGSTFVNATYKGFSAQASVTVKEPLVAIRLNPNTISMNVGSIKTVSVVKIYRDGSEECCTYSGVSWQSLNSNVASVSMVGEVRGNAAGNTFVSASYKGFTAQASVTVIQPRVLTGIRLNPASLLINVGQQNSFSAVKLYSDNTELCCVHAGVMWQSDNSAIAFVLGGEVQGISGGNTTIRATYQGFSAQGSVTVVQPVHLTSIRLSPSPLSVKTGEKKPLQVIKVFSDRTEICCASDVQWQSDNTTVASISSTGEVLGVAIGTANIKATYQSKEAQVTVTVTPQRTLTGLKISPSPVTLNPGEVKRLMLSRVYSDQTEACCAYSGVGWQSSNTSIVYVSPIGEIMGLAGGSVTITASLSGFSASAQVTVAQSDPRPKPPGGVSASVSGTTVSLNWNPVTQDMGGHTLTGNITYNIYRAAGGMYSPVKVYYSGTPFQDEGLPGAIYTYKVSAVQNYDNAGPMSEAVEVQIPLGDVPAPTGLDGVGKNGYILLRWDPVPVANVLEYCIDRAEGGGEPVSLGCYGVTDPPVYRDYSAPAPAPGQKRYFVYRVWARVWMMITSKEGARAAKTVEYSGPSAMAAPGPVVNFRAVAGTNYVNLWWDAGLTRDDVAGYRITRKQDNKPDVIISKSGRLTTTHRDEPLEPGDYTYAIVALNSGGAPGDAAPEKKVTVTGMEGLKTFTVTPESPEEIDPFDCDKDPDDLPKVATIKFSLNQSGRVDLDVKGMGLTYPLLKKVAIAPNVEVEMFWPPDRCDGPELTNRVLPGEYTATLNVETISVIAPQEPIPQEPIPPPAGQFARITEKGGLRSKVLKISERDPTVEFVSGDHIYACPDTELDLRYHTSPYGLDIEWSAEPNTYLSNNNLPVSMSSAGEQKIWVLLKRKSKKNKLIYDMLTVHVKNNNTTGGGTTTCPGIPNKITVPILDKDITIPRAEKYFQTDCDWCMDHLSTCGYAHIFDIIATSVSHEVARRYAIRYFNEGTTKFNELYKCLLDQGGGPDAFRHMYWQYLLADSQRFSREDAFEIGNRHENHGTTAAPNPCGLMTMDLSNNWIGREFAGNSITQSSDSVALLFYTIGHGNPNILIDGTSYFAIRTLIGYVDSGRADVITNCGVTGRLSDIYEQ